MLIMGTCLDVVIETKKFLSFSFDMKDMDEANFTLRIKIRKSNGGIMLTQEYYVKKTLKKLNHFLYKFVSIVYDVNSRLKKNKKASISKNEYAQVFGILMYLMNCTRHNIAYSVSWLSHYTPSPNNKQWIALNRILKYLIGIFNYKLMYLVFL